MEFVTLILLSVSLAMDAMAVTLSNALCYPNLPQFKKIMIPVSFGIFQMLMPVIGYYLGSIFTDLLLRYSDVVVLIVLGYLGIRMIIEGVQELKTPGGCEYHEDALAWKTIMAQAVATSIDALAIGVSFAALNTGIWGPAAIIGIITAIICAFALQLGSKLGQHFGSWAQILGGIILVLIGLKTILL